MGDPSTSRLTCNGLEVWIEADKKELTQYNHQYEEGGASCWIASEPDKKFSLRFQTTSPLAYDFSAHLYLDGTLARKRILFKENPTKLVQPWSIRSARVSAREVRDFMFGCLELTDDDAYLANKAHASIGEIKVVFTRVLATLDVKSQPCIASIGPPEKVHERSKKVFSHRVKYSENRQKVYKSKTYTTVSLETLATVIFRYRPLAILQATGIVPYIAPSEREEAVSRSVSPASSTRRKRKKADVKLEIDSDEDDEVNKREKELMAELEKVRKEKAERKENGRPPKKKMKKEPKFYFVPGEIIDLTI